MRRLAKTPKPQPTVPPAETRVGVFWFHDGCVLADTLPVVGGFVYNDRRIMLKTKSVYSPKEPKKDGLRILVTRFRGRGLPASRYQVWMANLGPSEKLLRTMQEGRMAWPKFARCYRAELFENQPLDGGNPSIKNHGQKFTLRLIKQLAWHQHVTLMCHCAEDQKHCHRHVLKKLILHESI